MKIKKEISDPARYPDSLSIRRYDIIKPVIALIFLLALSFPTAGSPSVAGDPQACLIDPVIGQNTSETAYPLPLPPGIPNNSHVHISPGRSVIGISVKADEISTTSPAAKELFVQGLYYLNHYNRFDEALFCLNESLEIDPAFAEAWSAKGVALYNLQRYDKAQACFDRALALEPFNPSIWLLKGVTFFEKIRHSIG